MNLSNKTLRNTLRAIHIVIAAMIGLYLYSPLGDTDWFGVLVKLTVLPVLLVTGLSMWQMPFITKLIKRRSPAVSADA